MEWIMKCPKCGFISFDYNETCPKCNKDISREREKMHHVPFRPDVPFLVGALIGETAESQTELKIHEPVAPTPLVSGVFDMESISGEESLEIDLGSSSEPAPTAEDFLPVEDEEISLGLEDLDLDKDDVLAETAAPLAPASSDSMAEETPAGPPALDEDTLSIELADLLEIETESESEDEYVNEEALTMEVESVKPALEESPVEIEEEESEITPEPEELFVFTETDYLEREEETAHDLTRDTASPNQDELEKLFSLAGLKEDKIEDYRIPGEFHQLPGKKSDASTGPGEQSSGPSGVWSEIERDLEELDFDIDDSK
jgi:hypothetical protein